MMIAGCTKLDLRRDLQKEEPLSVKNLGPLAVTQHCFATSFRNAKEFLLVQKHTDNH